ncbi:MAG: hypothetical protein AB1393_05110 [Candidatus Edwardsbacteria bacterium]
MEKIDISGKLYISVFERILNQYYRESLKERNVVFDLQHIEWAGFFPASLFFSWVKHLARQKNIESVRVLLPEREFIPQQVAKIFLNYDIFSQLNNDKKIHLPYHSAQFPNDGIPLIMPESLEKITKSFQYNADHYIRKLNLGSPEAQAVKDVFDVIIYELLENIYIHASGTCPHYAVAHAISSGKREENTGGLMAVFDEGVPYIEIMLGDLGSGINNKLRKFYKVDYKPYFNLGKNNRKEENLLTYAFDFFSTSDYEGRKKRIAKVISDITLQIKTTDVASGLYCVLQAVKSNQGQLIVRTPQAILGFDYYSDTKAPRITGRNDLGLKILARLPGTHYLLRIPLIKKPLSVTQRIPVYSFEQNQFDFQTTGNPNVIAPFKTFTTENDISDTVATALKIVNDHINIYRDKNGITLIMPPPFPLTPRAILIFLVGVSAIILRAKHTLIWCNPRVFSLFPVNIEKNTSPPYSTFISGSVYASELILNKFIKFDASILENKERSSTLIFSVLQPTLNKLKSLYYHTLKSHLNEVLKRPEVLHESGPFLIEDKYYTEKYYEIPKAITELFDRRRIAEWYFGQCDEIPDVIMLTTSAIKPLADEIVGIMEENGKRPEIFIFREHNAIGKILSHTQINTHGVILTDVICRGQTIQELLSWAYSIKISKIITMIDARANRNAVTDFLHLYSGNQKELIPVSSIIEDPIEIHNKPPALGKIYIVDSKTAAPTLCIRPPNTRISLLQMLKGPAKKTDALFSAHCEYKGKHYSHFLHIPKLMNALKSDIEAWIWNHILFIEKQSHGQKQESDYVTDEWHIMLCNPEIKWLETVLNNLLPNAKVEYVEREKLLKPDIPLNKDILINRSSNEKKKNWLIIQSAIASGETSRLSVEFVSRKAPDNILLLCFVARMDPYHRSFFDGIQRYRNAFLHFGIFLDFPIGAYPIIGGNCPMCTVNKRLDELQNLASQMLLDQESEIEIAIKEKISENKPIVLEYGDGKDNIRKKLSDHSMNRAYLRALYEGTMYDNESRELLYDELNKSNDLKDRFIEVISVERLSTIFTEDEIERRLKKSATKTSFPLIKNRLYEILEQETPPFQIGRVIGAIIHLIPQVFIAKAINMMKRFINSYTDIKEICIGLLLINALPLEIDDFRAFCRQNNYPKSGKLFSETIDIIKKRIKKDTENYIKTISTITSLQHNLRHSGNFSNPSKTFATISAKPQTVSWEQIKDFTERVCIGWKIDISPLISTLHRYSMWSNLTQRHTKFAAKLDELDSYVSKLSKINQTIIDDSLDLSDRQTIIKEICLRSIKIDDLRMEIGEMIEKELYFNFDNNFINEFPNEVVARNGSIIKIAKEIDHSSDLSSVFCNRRGLMEIVSEFIENLKKHKKNHEDGIACIKVFQQRDCVCLEFTDNISGDYNLEGIGGIRMTNEFCATYGCTLKHEKPNNQGEKKLIVIFPTPLYL